MAKGARNTQQIDGIDIRPISRADNATVADIIRKVMTEFKAVGCGYSINDSEVDDMFEAYSPEGSAFFVLERQDEVLGCGGYAPLTEGDHLTCELRKMYFRPVLRGLGMGAKLLKLCMNQAANAGYRHCYLETMENMHKAQQLYTRMGFKYLDKPMGNTGHTSCGTWMAKDI